MLKKYTTINWDKTLLSLVPPVLRKQKHALWLHTLLKPLSSVYEDTLYKMQHNGQVVYFEKVLNELLNKGREYKAYENTGQKKEAGLIFIDDATRPEVQYLYTNDEIENGSPPIFTFTNTDDASSIPEPFKRANAFLFLASDLDFSSTEYFNFRINIPSDLLITIDEYKTRAAGIANGNFTEIEKRTMLAKLDCLLIFGGEHPYSSHPDAVKIQTPVFHRVVNFYKLAGKSYETRQYTYATQNNNLVQPS